MESNWGLFIYILIGIAVFTIPTTIKFVKWLKHCKATETKG
jgi:hypothetical protein